MGERVTQTELARRLGLSEGAVRKHVKKGLYRASGDGLFDVDKCRALLEANRDPDNAIKGALGGEAVRVSKRDADPLAAPSAPSHGLPETSLTRARTAHAAIAAQKAKLALDKEKGKLIETAAALAVCRTVITLVCERLDGVPGQVAPRIAGLEAVAAERVVRDAINGVRLEIARLADAVMEVAGGEG